MGVEMDYQSVFFAALTALTGLIALYMVRSRRKKEERDTAALEEAIEKKQHIPATLYPIIQPDICIGSLSCLKACPEGDILGLVSGAAKLIEATHCIGHGRCQAECPVDAIKLVFGTSERGVDLPYLNEGFESSRAGVHIIGELGGMGLIKNATKQGVELAQRFGTRLERKGGGDVIDVAVVGAGPAGLALGVTAKTQNLSCVVLEQEQELGGTIAHYPRQKITMTEPVDLPGYGSIGKHVLSKEELLEMWLRAVKKSQVQIRHGVQVTGLQGDDGAFTLETTKGPLRARKVVLAIGRRGTPRKLGVPGESLPKVAYRLIDPDQYQGQSVVVVGGGDSALEASIQLAEQSDAEVIHSYRNEAFGKCRDANRKKIGELAAKHRIRLAMKSNVKEVREDSLTLEVDGNEEDVPNDYLLVCAGGEVPTEFLKKVGVDIRRYRGKGIDEGPITLSPMTIPGTRSRVKRSKREEDEKRKSRRLWFGFFILGVLMTAGMTAVGWDYYRLPVVERIHSPLHKMLKPAGPWGHGVGVIATGVMLTNFLYVARKRWRKLQRLGKIKLWLDIHSFIGFMAPVFISFHAAFQSRNQLATFTSLSLAIVVVTGIIGRFIWGLVPSQNGKALELADPLGRWERQKARLAPFVAELVNPTPVRTFLAAATAPAVASSLPVFLAKMPADAWSASRNVRHLKPLFKGSAYDAFVEAFWTMWRMRASVGFYKSLKRLMSAWRLLHACLAIFLAIMISAHVGVELYLGYKWIFR